MNETSQIREPDGTLTSESLAVLIIDALKDANIIAVKDFDIAIEIAKLEIDIRKHAGDY